MGSIARADVSDRAYDSGDIPLQRADGLLLVLDTPKGKGLDPSYALDFALEPSTRHVHLKLMIATIQVGESLLTEISRRIQC